MMNGSKGWKGVFLLALFALSMALNLAPYAVRKENEEDMI